MAKEEIELTKKVSEEAPETDNVKAKSKEEKSKDKDAKAKSKKADKKPKKGIVKYFKDARSEFKKVVWPTPKQTTNNTIVVIVMCVLAAAFIFGIDVLFGLVNQLLLGQG